MRYMLKNQTNKMEIDLKNSEYKCTLEFKIKKITNIQTNKELF